MGVAPRPHVPLGRMSPLTLASLLCVAFVSFVAGVVVATAVSALRTDDAPSCPAGRLKLEGLLNNTGEVVRLCYPPTWYVDSPRTIRLTDGSDATGSMAFLRTVRLHEVRQELSAGFVQVSSTIVEGIL